MAERMTERKDGILLAMSVAASTSIEGGKMVGVNATGFIVAAADAAAIRVFGVADHSVDNSAGSAGDKTCRVYSNKLFKLGNSATNAVVVADVGKLCFIENSQTVAKVPGTKGIMAGLVVAVATDGVWVRIPAGMPQSAAHADSAVGDDLAALKANVNAFYAKLRAAGLIYTA